MSTISTPFIQLKLPKGKQQKKILLPKSMTSLLKAAQKLYAGKLTIKSIIDNEGKFVRSIENVIPGMLYTVSETDPNLIPEPPIQSTKIATLSPKNQSSQSPQRVSASQSPKSPKLSPAPPSLNSPVVVGAGFRVFGNNIKIDDDEEDSEEEKQNSRKPENLEKKEEKNKQTPQLLTDSDDEQDDSEINKEKPKEKENDYDYYEEDEDEKHQNSSENNSAKNSDNGAAKENPYFVVDWQTPKSQKAIKLTIKEVEEHEMSPPPVSTEDKNETQNKENEEAQENDEESEEKNEFKDLLDEMELGITEEMFNAVPKLKGFAPFVLSTAGLEKKQALAYAAHTKRELFGINDMIKAARKALLSQTLPTEKDVSFIPRITVTGPKHSGKSTFLSVLLDELYIHIAACQLRKRFLVVSFDGEEIASKLDNYVDLFSFIIDKTISGLVKAYPTVGKFSHTIKNYFIQCLTNDKPGKLPQSIIDNFGKMTDSMNSLGQTINDAFVKSSSVPVILSNCFAFPILVANIFQMKTIFVIDNLDETDKQVTGDDEIISAADLLNFVLCNSCFIVSCKNEETLYNNFGIAAEIDVLSKSLRMSTTDIITETQYNGKISITFEGISKPFVFDFGVCGGCPTFCKAWEELNKAIDDAENIEEKEESDVEKCGAAFVFVNQLFEACNYTIKAVKRTM